LPEPSDTAFTLGGRFYSYGDITYRWLAPNGQVIKEGPREPSKLDPDRFVIEQPADGLTGEYRLEITSPEPFAFYYADELSSLRTQRFVVPEPERGFTLGGAGRWFFYVPPDCGEFRLMLRPINDSKRTVVEVFDPNDKPVKRLGLPFNGPDEELVIQPPAETRGKVWSIACEELNLVDVRGIPRWFTAFPETAAPSDSAKESN
jgi:hypothetical protein